MPIVGREVLDLQVDSKVYAHRVTYRIQDVARRSGFSATTLRYYEEIGLLPATGRTPAGYRFYDDRALQRLAFIARAKQLGCTLDEVADLATAWDGGQCGPVQDRLRTLVTQKLVDAQNRVAELMALTTQLQVAAAALDADRPDGPCDDRCGCLSEPAVTTPRAVSLTAKPIRSTAAAADAPPVACTLATRGPADARPVIDAVFGVDPVREVAS